MAHDPLQTALDDLVRALTRPLTREHKKGGWKRAQRDHWAAYFEGLKEGLAPKSAPRHLPRWLDHDGIQTGPLYEQIRAVQHLLYERFAEETVEPS
jgi:hypothetical protein